MKNGLLIFSAPSGSGKSTIVNWLMKEHPELKLAFSISCTSRAPRGTEQNGVEYFFLTPEEFKAKIEADEFLEYEEVYQDRFYGTLKSQVENQLEAGDSVVFDVDVKGGVNIKKFYGGRALSIFVQPPSVEELRRRLNGRGTDAPEVIEQRLAKANYELTFAPQFDHIVVNDNLEKAEQEVYKLVSDFLTVAAAQRIVDQLSGAGVSISLERLSWTEYLAALERGDFDLYLAEVRLTADFDLTQLVGTRGGLNYGGWSDPSTDGLLSAFRAAGAELRSSAAASLCSHLIKNGSVLTQWGRLSGLDPVRDNVFHGLENWVLDP